MTNTLNKAVIKLDFTNFPSWPTRNSAEKNQSEYLDLPAYEITHSVIQE